MVEESKLTFKLTFKALKAMFKYLSLKCARYYNINYPDQMADIIEKSMKLFLGTNLSSDRL